MRSFYFSKLYWTLIFFLQKGELMNVKKANDCFGVGRLINVICPIDTRSLILSVDVGVKELSRYNTTITNSCSDNPPPSECCAQENGDCYGPAIFDSTATDPYSYHKTYTGVSIAALLQPSRMSTFYLNCSAKTTYDAYTSYMVLEYRCYSVDDIVHLNGGRRENDGQGSALYLSCGSDISYTNLSVGNYTCSVETGCDDTLTLTSLDFRFSYDDMNNTCIIENQLIIIDGSSTAEFDCSSNNFFDIANLYTSVNNYMEIKYLGQKEGGYLWLQLNASNRGNLSVSCPSIPPQNVCKMTTTEQTETQSISTSMMTATEMSTSMMTVTEMSTSGNLTTTNKPSIKPYLSTNTTENTVTDHIQTSDNTALLVLAVTVGVLFIVGVILLVKLIRIGKKKNVTKETETRQGEEAVRGPVVMTDSHTQTYDITDDSYRGWQVTQPIKQENNSNNESVDKHKHKKRKNKNKLRNKIYVSTEDLQDLGQDNKASPSNDETKVTETLKGAGSTISRSRNNSIKKSHQKRRKKTLVLETISTVPEDSLQHKKICIININDKQKVARRKGSIIVNDYSYDKV